MNILITGANGFLGRHLCALLFEQDNTYHITAVSNRHSEFAHNNIITNDIHGYDWHSGLDNIDTVVHLIGRAHITDKEASGSSGDYYKTNVELTKKIASAAKSTGVKRFIFISSIKVNGERSLNGKFKESDTPKPEDHYGKSKLDAEKALHQIIENSDMKITIIRPPLIYGKGVKANFQKLLELSQSNWPLPFGAINNKRSLLYVENLVDFICTCMHSSNAANQTFLVSDDNDVSTTELIHHAATAANKKPFLIPIPNTWIKYMLAIAGKNRLIDKLCNNLQLDITKAKTLLNWQPPYTFKEGIAKTVQGLPDA